MALIKFERVSAPVGSVEFTYHPKPGDYTRKLDIKQVKESSAGNEIYVYDKGNSEEFRTLKFTNLPEADLTNFLNFVLNVVNGASYSFTFTDYDGGTDTARIWNADDIISSPVGLSRENLTVILRIE